MLDEPTNYLDRESLAALIEALKDFEGGVLVITHNREFSESICSEVWAMRDGHLEASGHNWVEGQGTGERIDKKKDEDEDDQFDSMGNKVRPGCWSLDGSDGLVPRLTSSLLPRSLFPLTDCQGCQGREEVGCRAPQGQEGPHCSQEARRGGLHRRGALSDSISV